VHSKNHYREVDSTSTIIVLKVQAVRTSETSVYFNERTQRCIPQGCHVHTRRRESLKSHLSVQPHIQFLLDLF
jgi:hypothetical protein